MSLAHVIPNLGKTIAALLLIAASFVLSGCFVTSQNPVQGGGVDADPEILGLWRNIDNEGKPERNYLHIIRNKDGEGVTILMVEEDKYMAIKATTVRIGANRFFNAMIVPQPDTPEEDKSVLGIHIVRYEVTRNTMRFQLMDNGALTKAVEAKILAGKIEGSGMTKSVRLTATTEELSAFLVKANLKEIFSPSESKLVRIAQ
jgi:hypothetical protein